MSVDRDVGNNGIIELPAIITCDIINNIQLIVRPVLLIVILCASAFHGGILLFTSDCYSIASAFHSAFSHC